MKKIIKALKYYSYSIIQVILVHLILFNFIGLQSRSLKLLLIYTYGFFMFRIGLYEVMRERVKMSQDRLDLVTSRLSNNHQLLLAAGDLIELQDRRIKILNGRLNS